MIFMALRSNAFKEFVLEKTDETYYKLFISKEVFGIKSSLYLKFEVINNEWTILADNRAYEIISHKKSVQRVTLTGRDVINIKTTDGTIIKCITFSDTQGIAPFSKYDITGVNEINVGKSQENTICYDFENLVSKKHCKIISDSRTHTLYDLSSNGIYVNSKRVSGYKNLVFGDVIEIFGLKLIYLNNILAVSSITGKFEASPQLCKYTEPFSREASVRVRHRDYYFNRSPRIFPPVCTDQIVVEAPTNPQLTKKKSLLLTIGPSLTMAIPMILGCSLMIISMTMSGNRTSAFMYTGLITAFGSALLGSLWAFLNLREANRKELEDESQRFNLYSNYLLEISDYVKAKYHQNRESLHTLYPSAAECCKYTENSTQLWNRNTTHSDFLYHRLGLGNIDFQMDISIPTEKFSMTYDSLKNKPKMLYENFKVLTDVPVGVDLSLSNLYGIVGKKSADSAYRIVDNLIAQITATTCYADAKIVFCSDSTDEDASNHFEYIKWLPHVWSENKDVRYYSTNKQETSDILFELSGIIRHRAEQNSSSFNKMMFRPHYFIFVTDLKLLDDELICKYIFDKNADYSVTTFLITDDYRSLPNSCENIIQYDDNYSGYFNLLKGSADAVPITFDEVSEKELLAFAKRISGIKVKEVEDDTSIAQTLSFFEMYNANTLSDFDIVSRWRKNKTNSSIKALVGKKAGGVDCYLDIHEKHHGPHGLIAGTTGSGKSELIQTFMLSLAINFSPDDIAFFVIDFKGGGMANLFDGLPHMAGQISNLSGNQISRAMISIKSENLRRQRIFSEFGVNNINLYTQLYKSGKATIPIPHLLIVIDEFAELKKEEPEFMRELISVAQVGRSLGVHLILATQKPSGTVDDNIWSNAKFRMCLRVQDRQDSNDMLHKPDAAYITQAGRCYLQVGNDEIYELFQSGYSGAVYDENDEATKSEIATMITPTGKTALVGSHTKMKLKEQEKNNWYAFLYRTIRAIQKAIEMESTDNAQLLSKTEQLPSLVINRAIKAGYNISMSNSELRTVENFINCMPSFDTNDKEAVEYITMTSSAKNLKLPELKEKTQLEALVDYITKVAKEHNYVQKSQLWMPLLKDEIELKEVVDMSRMYRNKQWQKDEVWSLKAVVGLYDDPHNQTQLPFTVDFVEGGHLAVCGMVSSGKSTFLQTLFFSLAIKYSPEDVNFYMLDFSSSMLSVFEKLPHTGGVIRDTELERTAKFFNLISSIIEERKRKIAGGSFLQYIKTHKDEKMPAIIIAIDNFASFKEKTENAYENLLIQLSREGIGYGIYLVFTAAGFSMSEIQSRIGDNFRTVVSLEMSDKFKYMDVLRTTRIDVMPEASVKGRGIALVENRLLEFQTAIAVGADNDYERNTIIEKACEVMDASYTGKRARPIPHIPENPMYEDICVLDEYSQAVKSQRLLPFAYNNEDATVYSVDLCRTFCYSITGKQRTGKTNVLKLLLLAASKKDADIVVIEKSTNEMKNLATSSNARYISTDTEILEYFKEITPDFIERNKFKKELLELGLSDEEIFEKMQKYKPVYIFVSDLIEFIDTIYHPQDNIGNMSGFFENIFDKGYLHNIYFFTTVNTDEVSKAAGLNAYHCFVSHKTGVHLGGNTASQRIFNFQNIHYTQMTKPSKKGEGLTPLDNDDTVANKIIIPLFGGKMP